MKQLKFYPFLFLLCSCSSIQMLDASATVPAKPTIAQLTTAPDTVQVKKTAVKKVYVDRVVYVERKPSSVPDEERAADEVEGISTFDLNYSQNHFDFWIKYFTTKERPRFTRHQANGELFRETVEKIMEEHGLPKELFYVGLIESGFNTKIRSHANAVGPWQFIKGTAVRYGLRVDNTIDERRNIHKSTHAAASYFKDLYNIFGSWELALCAYNAGEYRIINAIRKGNTRDYRELVKKKLLPKETVYYIPKVAAARELVLNRSKYNYPNFQSENQNGRVYVNATYKTMYKNFDWRVVAKELKLSQQAFTTLNPDFKTTRITASARRPVEVYLPNRVDKVLAEEVAPKDIKLREADTTHLAGDVEPAKTTITYRARRGDNFHALAKRFNVPVKELIELNRLPRGKKHALWVGQKIIIPTGVKTTNYRVRRGDNLTGIAKKYGTSIDQIVSFNGLSSKKIFVGQTLKIPN